MLVERLNEDSVYGDEDEGEIVPIAESALRWKYALVEMDVRAEQAKAGTT